MCDGTVKKGAGGRRGREGAIERVEKNLIDHIKITVKRGYSKAPLRKICELSKESVGSAAYHVRVS